MVTRWPFAFVKSCVRPKVTAWRWSGRTITSCKNNSNASSASTCRSPPNDYDALRSVGVLEATSLMALAEDDRINLQVALKARDINPKIRIVLRQFNRTLARKIEQNLPNCSVLSLASHAAATIVGCGARSRRVFYALQFPDIDGVLCGFSQRQAGLFGITGMTRAEAQNASQDAGRRARGENRKSIRPHRFDAGDVVVVFGQLRYHHRYRDRCP